MMRTLVCTLGIVLCFIASSVARGSRVYKPCEQRGPDVMGQVVVHQIPTQNGCLVYATSREKPKLIYRAYAFSDQGAFLIFNSFGSGNEKTMTGARSYFFLSNRQNPSYHLQNDGRVQITMANGLIVHLNPETARLDEIINMVFKEDPMITPSNGGGVDLISSMTAVWIDAGYATGTVAYSNPDLFSTIHFRDRSICTVLNAKLFHYEKPSITLREESELQDVFDAECVAKSSSHKGLF